MMNNGAASGVVGGGGGGGSGMITLLPASSSNSSILNINNSPISHSNLHMPHHRSQSTIVPMHSPGGGTAGFDIQALLQAQQQQQVSRLHAGSISGGSAGGVGVGMAGSVTSMAGILATPSAAATTNLTSPSQMDVSVERKSGSGRYFSVGIINRIAHFFCFFFRLLDCVLLR